MNGGDGNDFLSTSGIFGPAAAGSLMIGGDGDDSIQSGNSNDTMLGGADDDALTIGNHSTTRALDGGIGSDLLAFSGVFATGVVVDLNKTTQTIASGVMITLTNVENVNGTDAGDVLIGDANTNIMYAQGGDDSLYGGDGDDGINAGEGDDYIVGRRGPGGAIRRRRRRSLRVRPRRQRLWRVGHDRRLHRRRLHRVHGRSRRNER